MIDLHCHTAASDGVMAPSRLIKHAIQEGIHVLAIADHDTVNGIEEAIQAAKGTAVRFVPAIELSVDFPPVDSHLLGYGIDHKNEDFLRQLARLKSIREARIPRIVEGLNKAAVELTAEDVKEISRSGAPGRPHVARALVKKGYAPDVNSAIRTYLVRGKPGYVPKEKINLATAFKLIKNAGGWPVLAHPASLKCGDPGEFNRVIASCIPHGLIGIEVYATIHEDEDVEMFSEIAMRNNLIATGGSDFHGDKEERLGYYGKGRIIPDSCASSLLHLISAERNKP
jgi:3',5'-nucleoside bisphosphate phosphatase